MNIHEIQWILISIQLEHCPKIIFTLIFMIHKHKLKKVSMKN